jgi:N-acetylglutamate synthase-like GNAT family acetyltransferase
MTPGKPQLFARPLEVWERDGLRAALAKAGLSVDDLDGPGPLFWRFEQDDIPIGFGGLECHGRDALLRSLVTLPPLRRRGIGSAMTEALEVEARVRGCRTIYLLTEEPAMFERLGYARCERASAPPAILKSKPFTEPASASVVAMTKTLA